MVKGVNKSIIEVNDTGSEFFEKVVFYISPKYGNLNAKKLMGETEKFVFVSENKAKGKYLSLRKRMIRKRRILIGCLIGCILFGAVIVYVLL